MPEHSKGKKNRKIGRNKAKCELYAKQHRRTKNNPARKPHDPERMKHGERKGAQSKSTPVRSVPKYIPTSGVDANRNGISPPANS
jgi:hypothetical protein